MVPVSEETEGPQAPPGPTPAAAYRPLVGAHRAAGTGHPHRGYLLTVALLAGTASMPILAAISAGSATVARPALPDTSTPFMPTPSVGPVVVPLPTASQPAVRSTATGTPPPSAPPLAAALLRPARTDPRSAHRPHPGGAAERAGSGAEIPGPSQRTPAPAVVVPSPGPSSPGPTPTSPTPAPRPSPVPLPSTPSTSKSPAPRPRPTAPVAPDRPPAVAPPVRPEPPPPRPAPPPAERDAAVLLPAPVVAAGPLAEAYVFLPPWVATPDAAVVIHFG